MVPPQFRPLSSRFVPAPSIVRLPPSVIRIFIGQFSNFFYATGDSPFGIEVAHNGAGIAPEHLSHIFKQFYTTRANSGGSGLGLYIVKLYHRGTERHCDGTVNLRPRCCFFSRITNQKGLKPLGFSPFY